MSSITAYIVMIFSCHNGKDALISGGGAASQHRGNILASHPAALGSTFSIPPKNFEEKLSMLLRLINDAGKRNVDSGLKMLIEPV